jgi:hypothetical protein
MSRIASNSGLRLVRELDERLGLSALIAENIMDDRHGKNTQLPLPDLLVRIAYRFGTLKMRVMPQRCEQAKWV